VLPQCARILWLDQGRLKEIGKTSDLPLQCGLISLHMNGNYQETETETEAQDSTLEGIQAFGNGGVASDYNEGQSGKNPDVISLNNRSNAH
jgi:hypothetical protein